MKKIVQKKDNQALATAKYVRMSPTKVRRILKKLRYLNYQEALMILEFLPYRASIPIWQVLQSAAANAEHNLKLDKNKLYISEAFVNKGPVLKRFRSRAKGRIYTIQKYTCHITIQVQAI